MGHGRKGMAEGKITELTYTIKDPLELNLSYMPFIKEGGMFIPTSQAFVLGDEVMLLLQLPGKKDLMRIPGRVVWVTPKNALHHVLTGVGIQFTGESAKTIKNEVEMALDNTIEVGGYTYGITEEMTKEKK
jgi:type IV pilus assembly protein PilZ